MKVLYQIKRTDSWSGSMGHTRALAAAAGRLVQGHGRFTVVGPHTTRHDLKRAAALPVISRVLNDLRVDQQVHVRAGDGHVVFAARGVPAVDPRRVAMARWARWGVDHAPQIHYAQTRPIDFHFMSLPWTTDCSGSTISYAKEAGINDPSGYGYSGAGSTDSLLAHLKSYRSVSDAKLGDLILFHIGNDGKHVAVVVEPGNDPLLASHGSELGPLLIRYSVERRYHASESVTALDILSA